MITFLEFWQALRTCISEQGIDVAALLDIRTEFDHSSGTRRFIITAERQNGELCRLCIEEPPSGGERQCEH